MGLDALEPRRMASGGLRAVRTSLVLGQAAVLTRSVTFTRARSPPVRSGVIGQQLKISFVVL